MSNYLAAIWKCRFFWLALVRMDLRARYRRSVLGIGWSLLQPLAMTAILCTVFHSIFNMNVREYGLYLLVGMCFWSYLTSATLQGCQCLFQGEQYIRQCPAPMAIYPLRTVLGATVHYSMALGVVFGLTWGMKGFGNLPALWSLIPTLGLLFVLCWSMAVLSGFTTAYFPDTQHLAEVGLQILFYGTPIIVTEDTLRARGLGWIVDCNPLASILRLLREPILLGQVPSAETFAIAGFTVACVAGAATFTLVRLQQKIIFQL